MKTTRKELLGNMRKRPSFLLVHLFYNVNFSFFTLISMYNIFKAQNLTAIFRCSKNRPSLVLGRRSDRKANVGN